MSEHLYATDNTDFERLLSLGFSEIEASRLVYMKSHVTEEIEYREILEESRRLNFIRWLIENKRLSK
jgi:L-lactate utilization protein LutB